jgi:tRNA (cmo5U34)-methyltransferase
MSRGQFSFDPVTYLDEVRTEIPLYAELQEAVAQATVGVWARSILELGVGTGETARRVLERHTGADLVAIDGNREMVEVARAALPGAEVRLGNLEDELPAGKFDLVVSALVVHHLRSSAKSDLFKRVAARLRPGGRFVLGDVVVPEDPDDAVIPLEPGVDVPDRLDAQLAWLRDAGLHPAVVWSHQDLAVVAADR